MTSGGWVLSIDFGTTATAGAIGAAGTADLVEIENERRMPSMVCWKEASNGTPGRLLLGDEAENEAALTPQCLERTPKRKLAQDYMLLGSERVRVTDAIGQIFVHVLEEARPRQDGTRPGELRLTHPARWGEKRLSKLREAAHFAGFDDPVLVPEPVGAAMYFAEKELAPGDHVAVYDLGGGTFDTAVLRRTEDGFVVVGKPGGRDDLGGEDFDERLYRFLGEQVDSEQWQMLTSPDAETTWLRAHYDFRRDVRRAKERLSRRPDATVRTPIPRMPDLRVSATDFESLIRDDVDVTVRELERTISAAGQSVDSVAAIYLAGGSSQIPLVTRRIAETLGVRPRMLGDPKGVIALGAAGANAASAVNGAPAKDAPTAPSPAKPEPVVPQFEPEPKPEPERAPTQAEAERVPAAATQATRGPVSALARVGLAVATAGWVVLLISTLLPRFTFDSRNAWQLRGARYPILILLIGAAAVVLVLAGSRTARRRLPLLAVFVAAFDLGAIFQLSVPHFSNYSSGLWLAVVGGAIIAAGALIATRGTPRSAAAAGGAVAPRRGAALVSAVGLLAVAGSMFLPIQESFTAWGDGPKHYAGVLTVLAVVGIVLALRAARAARPAPFAWLAALSAFVLGEVMPLYLESYKQLQSGFWLAVLGALVAVVASWTAAVAQSR